MFHNTHAFSGFSVNDLQAAKRFYGETLGIDVSDIEMKDMPREYWPASLNLPRNPVFVYEKPDHVPATFTVLNFPVDDIDKAVDELVRRGARFEQYGGDIATDEKGICRLGRPLAAWFKDPAGNILAVLEE